MKTIIGNWKMNPETAEQAREIASRVEHGILLLVRSAVETVICPPAVFLPAVFHTLHFVKLGAQNVAAEEAGAFTGEISARQLLEYKTSHVIVGHSERRALGETDEFINKKIKILIKNQLHPILCVGFGAKKGVSNTGIKKIIKKQIQSGLAGIKFPKSGVTVAYEPVWAISKGLGTGKPATPAHAAEIASYIRELVPAARVIYGGSMDGTNVEGFARADLDGGLIGGASLKYEEFLKIIMAFSS